MLEQLDIHVQKNVSNSYLLLHIKVKSKWIIYLDVISESVKLIEGNIREFFL